jgi:O-6-methylguanine DNA methyltransferase
VAILVPCHRVISSDGSLGGYAGGLRKKSQMLRLEKVPTSWKRPEPTPA